MTILLDELGKVPWGGKIVVTGYFEILGHTSTSSSIYQGIILSLVGSVHASSQATVDSAGRFSVELYAPMYIGTGLRIQALFEGNDHYNKSESNVVFFETIAHSTDTTLEIDPLRLEIPSMKSGKADITLRPNNEFRIKGYLNDLSIKVPLSSKKIEFKNDFGLNQYAVTDKNGFYQLDKITTPAELKRYKIKAIFQGDSQYNGSASTEGEFTVQDKKVDHDANISRLPLAFERIDLQPLRGLGKQIFISYAREDNETATRLYWELKNNRYNPWLDKESLLPGVKWKPGITTAIRNSRFFVALLSSSSLNKKGYRHKELKEALDILDLYPEDDVFIIPARIENCYVEDTKLTEINYVDLFSDWEQGLEKILKTLDTYADRG